MCVHVCSTTQPSCLPESGMSEGLQCEATSARTNRGPADTLCEEKGREKDERAEKEQTVFYKKKLPRKLKLLIKKTNFSFLKSPFYSKIQHRKKHKMCRLMSYRGTICVTITEVSKLNIASPSTVSTWVSPKSPQM